MNTIKLNIDTYEAMLKELGVLKTENEMLKEKSTSTNKQSTPLCDGWADSLSDSRGRLIISDPDNAPEIKAEKKKTPNKARDDIALILEYKDVLKYSENGTYYRELLGKWLARVRDYIAQQHP